VGPVRLHPVCKKFDERLDSSLEALLSCKSIKRLRESLEGVVGSMLNPDDRLDDQTLMGFYGFKELNPSKGGDVFPIRGVARSWVWKETPNRLQRGDSSS
jgi:hypothetical protein